MQTSLALNCAQLSSSALTKQGKPPAPVQLPKYFRFQTLQQAHDKISAGLEHCALCPVVKSTEFPSYTVD